MNISKHKKTFGNLAKDYTRYRREYTPKVYHKLFSLLPKKELVILDLACGTGKSTEPLVKKHTQVFGVDHDERMIKEAKDQARKKKLKISYALGTAEKIPFKSSIFDVVTVGTAFHWFVNKKSILEIKRVLKNDGLLFVYWVLTVKDVPERDSVPSSFYQKYKWEKVPRELRDLKYIKKFFKDNGLHRVNTFRIPFTYKDTVEDQVGLMKTASAYEILSPEIKKQFVKELTAIRKERLGKRKYFIFEEEIQICFGFKKDK